MRVRPPAPKPPDAPAVEFSGARAAATLHRLLEGVGPHPSGSLANATVRDRIVAELTHIGYEPSIQREYFCGRHGACAPIENVVAVRRGQVRTSVLLSAHYDSVGAGPGAGDNASSVAVMLEIARALALSPPAHHDIVFLADDGEEPGLIGMEAFLASSPLASRVRGAVNLEARGVSGPSLLFETSAHNDWLVRRFGATAPKPAASSVFQVLYQRLPHETDFSALRSRGVAGFNFAFIESPERYHSSGDSVDAVDVRSLQHHGDNGLAAVRTLAESDIERIPAGRAVFFDLLGYRVVSWPEAASQVAAWSALVACGLAWVLRRRRGDIGPGVIATLAAFPLALLGSVLPALWLQSRLATSGGWPPLAFIALGLAAASLSSLPAWPRRPGQMLVAQGIWWSFAACAVAWVEPAAAYPFVVPAALSACAAMAAVWRADGTIGAVLVLVPAVAVVVLWTPLLHHMYVGIESAVLPVIAGSTSVAVLPLAALASPPSRRDGQRRLVAPLSLTAIAVLLCAATLVYTAHPAERLTVAYHVDAMTGRARWLVQPDRAGLGTPDVNNLRLPFPWSADSERAYAADAEPIDVAPPRVSITEDTADARSRTVRFRLSSPRAAPTIRLRIPGDVRLAGATVQAVEVPLPLPHDLHWFGGWWNITSLATPPTGVDVTLRLTGSPRFTAVVVDESPGLPTGAAPPRVDLARALASRDGHVTLVSRTFAFD